MQLSVPQAAEWLGVEVDVIRDWIAGGAVSATAGAEPLVDRAELLEYAIAQKLRDPLESVANEESDEAPLPPPSVRLSEAVGRGGVLTAVAGARRDVVLHNLALQLHLPAGIDREKVFRHLMAREQLGSTAIGGGYAIPHSRQVLLPGLSTSSVALALLQGPVPWEALDHQPVHTLFVLLSRDLREHVRLLPRIVHALRDADFRAALEARAPEAELLAHIRRIEAGLGE